MHLNCEDCKRGSNILLVNFSKNILCIAYVNTQMKDGRHCDVVISLKIVAKYAWSMSCNCKLVGLFQLIAKVLERFTELSFIFSFELAINYGAISDAINGVRLFVNCIVLRL